MMADEPLATITYDRRVVLESVPPEKVKSILVKIDVEPKDGGYIIYGWDKDDQLLPIQSSGGHVEFELPFVKNEIYIKYLTGLTDFSLATLGFQLDR